MRALDWVFHVAGVLAAMLLAAVGVLTFIQIVGRLLGFLISTGTEFAGYCMAGSTFLALAWTLRMGGHIRVNLFVQKLSTTARRWLELWCLLVAAVAVGVFAYSSVRMVWDSYVFGDVSGGLVAVPIWIPQLSMALGAVLMEVAIVEQLALVVRGHDPLYRRFEDKAGGTGDTAASEE